MTRGWRLLVPITALGALVTFGAAARVGGATVHPQAAPSPAATDADAGSSSEVVDRIVATIDGEPVTLVELRTFADQVRERAHNGGGEAPADDRAMLDELVLEKILRKQVAAQGVAATDQQIDAYIASIKERNHLDDAQLKEALTQQGLTWDQYRDQVRADIERAALINKEIRNKVNVSPEEIERYYKEHLDEYGTKPKVHVRLISFLLPPGAGPEQKAAIRADAERVRAEAASGKDFAALAKAHSQGPGADDGGDIGEVERGQMQPAFEKAVFALKPGEVSEVVETDSGFHIFKVEERSGEAHQPLAAVSDDIREKLYRENMEARYDRWLKQDLRSKYHVEILL
jgi:peptidyl-prolyl cis-trans isomerase SurA